MFQMLDDVSEETLLLPPLWCGHYKVNVVTKLFPPGDKERVALESLFTEHLFRKIVKANFGK